MPNMLKATLWGLGFGLIVFLTSGYSVYAILWHYAGMDNIPADSPPAVGLGGVWAFGWGVTSGAIIGLVSCALCVRYCYRRYAAKSLSQ
jgi:hypothetical protein